MIKNLATSVTLFLLIAISSHAQNFPRQLQLSGDGRMIVAGERTNAPFYNQNNIPILYLNFSDTANFWDDLIAYHDSLKDYPATLVYNGVTYDSVGVRFKGNSSYENIGNSLKKSFNISLNAFIDGQDIDGYNTLNLNNCYDDPSFMREVLYENQIKRHVPAAQTNFAHLYINGADWGLYANVQQLNKDFQKEWFMSNDGANFRSSRPPGSTASGSVIKASLLNLGQDTAEYQKYYTLKSSEVADPWKKLVDFCTSLDTISPSRKVEALSQYLDIDRALWFLASEIAFNDFDSYIEKGKNDFYVIYEKETGRFAPIEFDGNDVMDTHYVNSVSALRHQNDTMYPLMSKIIGVPEIRQRYLAHMRTLVADEQDTLSAFPLIDSYYALIDSIVQADTIKLYSYAAFQNSPSILKYYIRNRRLKMLGNSEVDDIGPTISNVVMISDSTQWKQPEAGHVVQVRAKVISGNGISKVTLFSAPGIVGNFAKTPMFDDGLHNDSLAGDGIFAASIAGQPGGTWMRYYIEAAANNSAKTVSYDPPGAEHNIYTYLVKPSIANDSTTIVINEIMARNTSTVTDSAGQYEDWIELYNNSNNDVDISGYYLSDNEYNIFKWQIPTGTILKANEYLTIWADEDQGQGKFHTNFKFSASGEQVLLLNTAGELINKINFGPQPIDQGFARIPNGTGSFIINAPSFGFTNNPKPILNISANNTIGCGSVLTAFSNSTANAVSYVWDFGDGSPLSTQLAPTHLYATPGTYSVIISATGGGWTVSDTLVDLIKVYPQTNFSFATDTIIALTQNYLLAADTGYAAYSWNTGNISSSINIDTSGNYCVEVFSSLGCSNSVCVYVKIPPLAVASFIADQTQGCAPLTSNFTNTSTNGVAFNWDFGDGTAGTNAVNPQHTFAVPGSYNVKLTAYNSGIDSSVYTFNFTAFPNPSFAFADDTINATSATYLLDVGAGFSTYLWNIGASNQSILVDSIGTYCVIVGNQFGCIDTACVFVNLNGLGIATISNSFEGSIFPNPADNVVMIKSALSKTVKLSIFNSIGALVYTDYFTGQINISTAQWPNGIYLVKLDDNSISKLVVGHK